MMNINADIINIIALYSGPHEATLALLLTSKHATKQYLINYSNTVRNLHHAAYILMYQYACWITDTSIQSWSPPLVNLSIDQHNFGTNWFNVDSDFLDASDNEFVAPKGTSTSPLMSKAASDNKSHDHIKNLIVNHPQVLRFCHLRIASFNLEPMMAFAQLVSRPRGYTGKKFTGPMLAQFTVYDACPLCDSESRAIYNLMCMAADVHVEMINLEKCRGRLPLLRTLQTRYYEISDRLSYTYLDDGEDLHFVYRTECSINWKMVAGHVRRHHRRVIVACGHMISQAGAERGLIINARIFLSADKFLPKHITDIHVRAENITLSKSPCLGGYKKYIHKRNWHFDAHNLDGMSALRDTKHVTLNSSTASEVQIVSSIPDKSTTRYFDSDIDDSDDDNGIFEEFRDLCMGRVRSTRRRNIGNYVSFRDSVLDDISIDYRKKYG